MAKVKTRCLDNFASSDYSKLALDCYSTVLLTNALIQKIFSEIVINVL